MITFPAAKINIGLQVLGKREDGFHDLNTIFYPIPFFDALEVINDDSSEDILLTQTGFKLDTTESTNLVAKAYYLLKEKHPEIKGAHVHLHKSIPAGAGLGGGSSDAASMLKLLNDCFALNLTKEQLSVYALTLGSDCPFFIYGKPSLAQGRGEKLTEINLDLTPYDILIVNPGIHISTAWAFSQLQKFSKPALLEQHVLQPVSEWKQSIVNDFEMPVGQAHPEIRETIDLLYNAGAMYASLTGTGSTVYGIFKKDEKPPINLPTTYFIRWC